MSSSAETASLLQFPCDFPIKAMGLDADDFAAQVVMIVQRHAPDLRENAVTLRPSGQGRYVSVTVTIQAQSQAQLDAIYQDLTACKAVLMAL